MDAESLIDAIKKGDEEAVRSAINSNAALAGARDEAGISAVLTALYHRRKNLLEILLQAGPSLDGFESAALGRPDLLLRLAVTKPDLATAWSPDGFTALHLACFFGHLNAALLLLNYEADVNAVSRNPMKVQPLHSAAADGKAAIVVLLLERGADVNARQQGGFTALHAAIHHANVEMAEILLGYGADPSIKTTDGRTGIEMALEKGDRAVLRLLGIQ